MTLRVARVLQAALSRAMALGFALGDIAEGAGSVPLPMACAQAQPALCRSWDAIRYGGQVHLVVRGSDAAARGLARQLPSSTSAAFLHPLADALTAVNGNLGQLDPAMLAPAEVWVSNADSGNTWHAGGARMDLLRQQWLAEA